MTLEFTIDIIEHKKDRLFITGLALADIPVATTFTHLYQYRTSKKSRKQLSQVELVVESIIVDGNPVESVTAQQSGMIVLVGDASAIEDQAHALRWRKKSGRYLRTSEEALTLATE